MVLELPDASNTPESRTQQEYEEETQRSSEIDDLETYMKSSEYIEDVAKSKLGLTYKNEISVFYKGRCRDRFQVRGVDYIQHSRWQHSDDRGRRA